MHRVTLAVIFLLLVCMVYIAGAEESTKFILCNPKVDNHVSIRRSPRKGSEETGQLYCGDSFITDGKIKNGYLHILGMTEYGEGWVHLGYVVEDKPVIEKCKASIAASGRVMSWRMINGKKNRWLNVGDEVKVFARSEEWAVTSRGYIRTKYLEVWYGD